MFLLKCTRKPKKTKTRSHFVFKCCIFLAPYGLFCFDTPTPFFLTNTRLCSENIYATMWWPKSWHFSHCCNEKTFPKTQTCSSDNWEKQSIKTVHLDWWGWRYLDGGKSTSSSNGPASMFIDLNHSPSSHFTFTTDEADIKPQQCERGRLRYFGWPGCRARDKRP